MASIAVIATAGAGGDLQPLIAAALGLRARGHEMLFVGDKSVERSLSPLAIEVSVLPPELDLGPWLTGAIRVAMDETGGDLGAAGPIIRDRMTAWAGEMADPVSDLLRRHSPEAAMTSLFGVEVLHEVDPSIPWSVVNSTFYVGPNPPRPVEQDFGPRAVPLIAEYASLLESATLTLHATDQIFDLSFSHLPPRHEYVGPLGIWEPPIDVPEYLDEPGDPWVLVSISSQLQDDIALADAALGALAKQDARVIVTLGPDHHPDELASVPSNAHVERAVPHSVVLEKALLFVSHAGHGSVMKALWHGCPMVLVPWGRDQPGVAARAEALGVAEIVPRELASPEAIANAVSRVLSSDQCRERIATHSARLRTTDPTQAAVSALEKLL